MIKKTYKEIVMGVVIVVVGAGVLLLINEAYNFFTLKLLKDIWEYSATFTFTLRLVYVVGVLGLLCILYSIVFKLIKKEKERRKQLCDANRKSIDKSKYY
jgi:hypothetical protein